jgi:hypothetical protein
MVSSTSYEYRHFDPPNHKLTIRLYDCTTVRLYDETTKQLHSCTRVSRLPDRTVARSHGCPIARLSNRTVTHCTITQLHYCLVGLLDDPITTRLRPDYDPITIRLRPDYDPITQPITHPILDPTISNGSLELLDHVVVVSYFSQCSDDRCIDYAK